MGLPRGSDCLQVLRCGGGLSFASHLAPLLFWWAPHGDVQKLLSQLKWAEHSPGEDHLSLAWGHSDWPHAFAHYSPGSAPSPGFCPFPAP